MNHKETKPIDLEIGQPCSLDGHWDMGVAVPCVGRLTYNAADLLYEVEAILDENPERQPPLRELGGASHGRLVTGEEVTLLRPFNLGTTSRYPGTATARRGAGTILIGREVRDRSEPVFTSLRVFTTDLEAWLGVSPFEGDAREDGLRMRDPEEVSASITSPAGVLASTWHMKVSREDTRRVLEVRSRLNFTPAATVSVRETMSFSYRLRQVLCLLSGNDMDVRRLHGLVDGQPINILYGDRRAASRRPRNSDEFLFSRRVLGDEFATIINKAFALYDKYKSAIDLLDVAKQPGQVVELRFLTAVIALEAFDRCRTDERFVEEAQFAPIKDALVAAIPSSCPSDLRQALEQRMQFGNERSLGYRLRHLMKSLPPSVQQQLTGGRPANDFVEGVKNARNHLVHWPIDRPGHDPMSLSTLSDRLRAWLHLCLLSAIDIPAERVIERMMKHPNWRHALAR